MMSSIYLKHFSIAVFNGNEMYEYNLITSLLLVGVGEPFLNEIR